MDLKTISHPQSLQTVFWVVPASLGCSFALADGRLYEDERKKLQSCKKYKYCYLFLTYLSLLYMEESIALFIYCSSLN